MTQIDIPELDVPFLFKKRPIPIPADLRPGWRIGVIVQLLKNCCRQGRSSFSRLHVLSWGIRTDDTRQQLLAAANGDIKPDDVLVRIEPSLNRAVDLAIGDGLIRRTSGDKVELTGTGRALADEIDGDSDIYVTEKSFIAALGRRLTEDLVTRMFG